MSLLTARGVARRFGSRIALEATDVSLAAGEVVALVGPNGAGTELYRLPGALTALPLLAVGRAMREFFSGRIRLEPWARDEPADDVPVELVERR